MATGSFVTQNYSRSQSEVPRDLHNGTQRINPENRVGSSFRIIPEQYFSGIENIDDFLENIDHNLAYYEIPAQLACAYLKGHLKGRALDWLEVLGYRVIEDKTTDYAHLKQALSEQFPVLNFKTAYLGKGRCEDLFVLPTELNLEFDKSMTIATLKDLIIGSENYDEELTKNIHSTIVEDHKAREKKQEEQKEKLRIEERE
ncbi:uncharacterized protein TNCV_5125581 [Trichonephila clavipes]|nr:uncharacterized protein TNCV_5125581 [Trichonephila clavipes]